MRKAYDEQLAAERQKWLDTESEPLKAQLASALQQMKEQLGRLRRADFAALRH